MKLVGLSVDSVYSHLAWIDDIRARFGVAIPFPIIADNGQQVSRLYGMTGPKADTATVRSVFFIDPAGIIRATLTYPAAIGRNIEELLRVVDAFQENTTSGGCAIPANWRPGEPTVTPAPTTAAELHQRWHGTRKPGYRAWYYQVNEDPSATP